MAAMADEFLFLEVPESANLVAVQDDTFAMRLQWRRASDDSILSLTGSTLTFQCRADYRSPTKLLDVALTIDSSGEFADLRLTPAQTRSLPFPTGPSVGNEAKVAVYDIQLKDGDSNQKTLLAGEVRARLDVTRVSPSPDPE
jgi:hypothetical protein